MSSKRQHGEHVKTGKKKKKKNTSDETAHLSAVVEDEEVKSAVKEAWSHNTHYSHGEKGGGDLSTTLTGNFVY